MIEFQFHSFKKIVNVVDPSFEFTTTQVANEDKALEWMRVSFKILERAILESLTNPELLFQTLCFFGINPKTNADEIRIIAFNLDIKFELLANHQIRVRIYNDKEGVLGSSKKAALEGDFSFRKREMLDELIKLVSALSPGIKIIF